jgi:serine protease
MNGWVENTMGHRRTSGVRCVANWVRAAERAGFLRPAGLWAGTLQALLALAAGLALAASASAQSSSPPRLGSAGSPSVAPSGAPAAARPASSARVIVAFKPDAAAVRARPLGAGDSRESVARVLADRAARLSARAGGSLSAGRAISARSQVVMARGLSSAELARRLSADPDVAYAVPDKRRRALAIPNDPLYLTAPALGPQLGGPVSGQWYLRPPSAETPSAVNAQAAWDFSTGAGIVVAVLDTGIRPDHLDLRNQLVPGLGYDFIRDTPTANDGSVRDGDPSDPGDWITEAENNDSTGDFYECVAPPARSANSSWHGTMVSGIVAAQANNGLGMAGTAHGARILSVRVLGKCGGWDSDIQAGMRWAAGLSVAGVPDNAYPARVLNLSLGSADECNASYRDSIDAVRAQGAVIVAAAGNSAGHAVGTPANCPGVLGVAGLRHVGSKVGFSDLGPEVAIAAPGGNCVNTRLGEPCLYPILSTVNDGETAPLAGNSSYTDAFNISVGTSFATPIVAGTAAMMLAARPEMTPDEVRRILQATARPFPTTGADNGTDPTPVVQCRPPDGTDQLQCYCTTALCGAGMLDAGLATQAAAQAVLARIGVNPSDPQAGQLLSLSSSESLVASGRQLTAWAWRLLDGGGIVSGFEGASDAATASLMPTAAGNVTVMLTITDSTGAQASAERTITIAAAPVNPGTGSSSSSGGTGSTGSGGSSGGTSSPAWLLALVAAALALRRMR